MIKAVIFDMDGLMIDSERVTFEASQKALQQRGYEPSIEFYKTTLGTNEKTTKMLYKQYYGDDVPFSDISVDIRQYIEDNFQENGVPVKNGLVELLQYLKDNNYKTIVATSSARERLNRILKQANLTAYFDGSICGDEVTNSKPDPEIFVKACQKLRVLPDEAIVLEDSEAGIQAAFLSGIPVICIPDMKYPQEKYAKKCYLIKNSLTDVLSWFQSK